MDALVWVMTELTGTNDAFSKYAKDQACGDVQRGTPKATTDIKRIHGLDPARCECSSAAWAAVAGKQICFKCGKARPE